MPIKVIASGGIGNQLFQYASARAIALRANTDLVIDTRNYPPELQSGPMRFCIDEYPIEATIVRYGRGIRSGSSILRRSIRKLVTEPSKKRFFGSQPGYDPRVMKLVDGSIIIANLQSEMYFKEFSDLIKREIDLGSIFPSKFNYLIARDSVSVHVRRGDYLQYAGFPLRDPAKYYGNALSYIRDQHPDSKFLIFSDDIAWCQQQSEFANCSFFLSPTDWDHRFELYIMSQCRHHIVANSSFSWWAAWWNWNQEKIVIAPEYWVGENRSRDIKIVPDHWIVI